MQLDNPSAVTAVIGIRMNGNLPFALLFCDYKGFTNGYIVESQLTIIDSQQIYYLFSFSGKVVLQRLYTVYENFIT